MGSIEIGNLQYRQGFAFVGKIGSIECNEKRGTDEVFNAALIGGLAGAAAGIGLVALLELLKETGKE